MAKNESTSKSAKTFKADEIKEQEINNPEELNNEEKAEESSSKDNELEKKYNELYDKYLRTLAEYDNFKKRTQKEKEELYVFAAADTVGKLLPVIDNLERAIASVEEKTAFSDGVEKVLHQCFDILEKMGVTKIETDGAQFDPNVHNAVMHIEDENLGTNVIAEELMAGYKYKDKVIRYSMVKVAN